MIWCAVLGVFFVATRLISANRQPNIVVIMADDMGFNDVGYRGSNQVQTPNIDALAYNGVILNRFYTPPICTPSRTSFLTGNYPSRTGLQGMPLRPGENRSLPLDMPTMAERLKEIGYKTHLVGKWHLGHAYKTSTPTGRGFDTHFGYWSGYIGYFDHKIADNSFDGLDLHDNFEPVWSADKVYATDLFTSRAVEIIRNHDDKTPLFLFLSHLAPHTGATVGAGQTILEEKDPELMNRTFGYVPDVNRRKYVDIVKSLDDSVGTIVKTLSSRGLMDNTIILFMSDNGGQTQGLHENFASNWPLRGLKFTHFEGGIRGTAIFYSKRVQIKGNINDNLVHMTDWLPTFYAAGGGDVNNLGRIDGINQLDTLHYNLPTKREEFLIHIDDQINYSGFVGYHGRYKLINGTFSNGIYDGYYGDTGRDEANPNYNVKAVLNSDVNRVLSQRNGTPLTSLKIALLRAGMDASACRKADENPSVSCAPFCLFDLKKDPCELKNIARRRPDILRNLDAKLSKHWKEVVPRIDAAVDPNSNPDLFGGVWSTWLDKTNHLGERHLLTCRL